MGLVSPIKIANADLFSTGRYIVVDEIVEIACLRCTDMQCIYVHEVPQNAPKRAPT